MTSKKPHVLIVDDSADNLAILARLLESCGAEVKRASNSGEALEAHKSEQTEGRHFNLVITDIVMPEVGGNDLALSLRNQGYKGPLVAVTSNATLHGKKESYNSGIDLYLSKTVLKKGVIEVVLDQFGIKRV